MVATARVEGLEEMDLPPETFTDQAVYIRAVREGISGEVVRQAIAALGGQRELFVRLLDTTSANLSRYVNARKSSAVPTPKRCLTPCGCSGRRPWCSVMRPQPGSG